MLSSLGERTSDNSSTRDKIVVNIQSVFSRSSRANFTFVYNMNNNGSHVYELACFPGVWDFFVNSRSGGFFCEFLTGRVFFCEISTGIFFVNSRPGGVFF